MSNLSDLIRKIEFFEPLDSRIVNKVAQSCIPREYSAGDHIVRQGDSGLGLYFITDGRAKVEVDRDGAKTIVAELQAGAVVGELSLIDQKARSANVICLTDTSCLLLTRDRFEKLMRKYPEIAVQMARVLAGRLRNMDENVSPRPAPVRERRVDPASEASPVPDARAAESDTKRLKDLFTDRAGLLLLLQPLLRVSMAIVGCPVTVHLEAPASESFSMAIGPVKVALFPACEDQVIRLRGFGDGNFQVAVFCPAAGGGVSANDDYPLFGARSAR